jgi:hypothetical protein
VSVLVRAAVWIGLGPQLIRDLLLRAGRRRLIVLELRDGRFPRSGERFVRGISGSSGHDEASPVVVLPAYARRESLGFASTSRRWAMWPACLVEFVGTAAGPILGRPCITGPAGDTASLTDVAELPGADWLPSGSLTEGGV